MYIVNMCVVLMATMYEMLHLNLLFCIQYVCSTNNYLFAILRFVYFTKSVNTNKMSLV